VCYIEFVTREHAVLMFSGKPEFSLNLIQSLAAITNDIITIGIQYSSL